MAYTFLLFAVILIATFKQILVHSEVTTNGKGWWYPPGEMMHGIYKQQVAYLHPYSYLFGGLRSNTSKNMNGVSCFRAILKNDAVSHSSAWQSLFPQNAPDLCHFASDSGDFFAKSSVTIDNIVYFAGHGLHGEIYSFNLSSETWINGAQDNQLSPMPFPIQKGCAVDNGTHIMVFGGQYRNFSTNVVLNSKLQIYDVADNSWSTSIIPMTINKELNEGTRATRQWMAQMCALVNHTVYIFGGEVSVWTRGAITSSNSKYVYKYMVQHETWHNVTQFEYGKDSGWALYYQPTNVIYLFSAKNAGMKYWIFDVESEGILGSASSISEVESAPALYVEETNQILVFGGAGTNYYSDHWELQPTIQIWNVSWMKPSSDGKKQRHGLYLGMVVGGVVVAMAVIVVVVVLYCRRSKKYKNEYLLNES